VAAAPGACAHGMELGRLADAARRQNGNREASWQEQHQLLLLSPRPAPPLPARALTAFLSPRSCPWLCFVVVIASLSMRRCSAQPTELPVPATDRASFFLLPPRFPSSRSCSMPDRVCTLQNHVWGCAMVFALYTE
jgi:hypothetical protein